jgi:hypothetical protein
MTTMPTAVREAFEGELARARLENDRDEKWRALERAHILSQQWPWPHTRAHWHMLTLAVRTSDLREVTGQLVRLAGGGLVSALGRAPIGNNGRSSVPSMQPMPVPAELARILSTGSAG